MQKKCRMFYAYKTVDIIKGGFYLLSSVSDLVHIRPFEEKDISNKIKWINNPKNNMYLHYDLPLEFDKTLEWFKKNKERTDRYDAVIQVNNIAVGLIGLLGIDKKNRKAEFYISMGEEEYKGKGVAYKACKILLAYSFKELNLNKVYLNVDADNIAACRLYEKVGFVCEGVFKEDMFFRGKFIDRKRYAILRESFYEV